MEFLDELELRVEVVDGVKRLSWNGTPLRDDDVRRQTAELSEYAVVAAECRFTDAEVMVVRLLPENRPVTLTARREIKGFIERSYMRRAIEELAALGEDRVRRDKELLGMRIRATAGLVALEDFLRLLDLPETSPVDAKSAFENLPGPARKKAAIALAHWVEAYLGPVSRWGVPFILQKVPVAVWPLGVVIAACQSSFESLHPSDEFEPWLARAVKLAPADTRVVDLQRRAERRTREVDELQKKERAEVLASRPDFEEVERLFGATLPVHLRHAWEEWYEGKHPELRFIHAKRDRLDDLLGTADFVFSEHGPQGELAEEESELKKLPGRPYPILPFADGTQDSDYFVLDLSRPLPNSDYPVLLVMHDNVDGVVEVASSAADWLERGAGNWDEE